MKFLDKYFGRAGNRMFQSFYLYAQEREGNLPDRYVQDCKYFDKYRSELMQMAFGKNFSDYDPRVSIHVRRGKNPSVPEEPNYSDNPFYVDLTKTDYYQKAMKELPGWEFVVFSDDIEWCKQQEMFKGCHFQQGTEEEDFEAMAKCIMHIIANSSFSYMAAYLGGGKTIYPKQWFADGIKRVGTPEDWICV